MKRSFFLSDKPPKLICIFTFLVLCLFANNGFSMNLPGSDNAMDKLTAAGTLLKLVDSFIFVFGARILAGLSVLAAGWNLKEQRFSMAIVCIFGAIIIATVPMWIGNFFEMGGGSIFAPPSR
jgi:hypothetical protein